MIAKKDNLQKKRTKRDAEDSESESESYQSSSTDSDSSSSSNFDADSGHDVHEEPPYEQEVRSKKRNDPAVVGSNEPLIITQQSVAVPDLGGDDSGNIAVEGPVVVPSQPFNKENEVLQAESEQCEKGNDAEVEGEHAEVEGHDAAVEGEDAAVKVPPNIEDVVPEELQPEPLVIIIPIQPEQPSKSYDDEVGVPPHIVENVLPEEIQPEPLDVIMPIQPEHQSRGATEVDPDPINIQTPVEPELTLRPWLQAKANTNAAKGPIESPDEVITHVLLSMNQEGPSTQGGEQTKDEDQCKTPETAPVTLKERCFIWGTMDNDNKFETIFQLRGPNTIEAKRYNFMTMAPETCIDMQMVSLVCHVLNREDLERFQRDVYCVPPEILIRMFQTYGTNYLDKKTKMPYLVSQLKDQHYLELLDKEKLRRHSFEFYVVDSVYGTNTNLIRNKLHRFTLRVWARAQSLLKKQTISLQLRFVDVPKQPNPTDCGVYVMKWMQLIEVAALSAAHTFKLPYSIEEWSQDQLDQFRKDIVAKVIMSMENTLNVEAIRQASNMTLEAITESRERMGRKPKLSAAFKSPFVKVSTAELEKKH
ncbi:hypothetical protein PIB30_059980 [Stylosanthes scabra]|uniref:Ubiquitin-like protease family profile domain-containing protein n=1 Tax=Stylosanthes scabra TaxID=79078 RepID=A0ABU6ZJ58_9FABA|nr:hypothetical protein [Stylosanthes scabra]